MNLEFNRNIVLKFLGPLVFHIKKRPADYQARKRKKKPFQPVGPDGYALQHNLPPHLHGCPYLLELNADGSDVKNAIPQRHYLQYTVTEVGRERSALVSNYAQGSQYMQVICILKKFITYLFLFKIRN